MAATIAATVSTAQMVGGGENHQLTFEMKIAGQDFGRCQSLIFRAMKFHHAVTANAGLVSQFGRDLSQQFIGNFHEGTPAGTLVNGRGAKLAMIWLPAEGAWAGIDWLGSGGIHFREWTAGETGLASAGRRIARR